MAPKSIQSCGKVRAEPKVDIGERDSIALRMASEGITSTPEYIAMIDEQVASGQLRDNLADAIRLAVADGIGTKQKYEFHHFISVISESLTGLAADPGYRSSFEFNKISVDSMIDCARVIRAKFADRPKPELTNEEQKQFLMTMSQLASDKSGDRDVALVREVDRALLIMREKILDKMGVDIKTAAMSPLEAMGVGQMDIDGEDGMDDPSAVHMDMELLGDRLAGVRPSELQNLLPNDPCGRGCCCGKDKPKVKD